MNPQQVLISVPTRGQIQWATVTRLDEIRDTGGYPPINYQPGNLSVAQTRNRIVATFQAGNLRDECAYEALVMVDDDIVPSPLFLDLVLGHLDDYGMIGLPHPMPHPKDRSRLFLGVFDDPDDGSSLSFKTELATGLHECDALATGCVVISRKVLDALAPNPFRITNDPFAEIATDDFEFCRDVRAAGFKIGYWWDGWYCDHHTVTALAPLFEATL